MCVGFDEGPVDIGFVVFLFFDVLLALEYVCTHTSEKYLHLQPISLALQSCSVVMAAHDFACCVGAYEEVE